MFTRTFHHSSHLLPSCRLISSCNRFHCSCSIASFSFFAFDLKLFFCCCKVLFKLNADKWNDNEMKCETEIETHTKTHKESSWSENSRIESVKSLPSHSHCYHRNHLNQNLVVPSIQLKWLFVSHIKTTLVFTLNAPTSLFRRLIRQ